MAKESEKLPITSTLLTKSGIGTQSILSLSCSEWCCISRVLARLLRYVHMRVTAQAVERIANFFLDWPSAW